MDASISFKIITHYIFYAQLLCSYLPRVICDVSSESRRAFAVYDWGKSRLFSSTDRMGVYIRAALVLRISLFLFRYSIFLKVKQTHYYICGYSDAVYGGRSRQDRTACPGLHAADENRSNFHRSSSVSRLGDST